MVVCMSYHSGMTNRETKVEFPVDDELATEVEALAAVHTRGDVPRMLRLLLLQAVRPDQFVAELSPITRQAAA